MHLKGAVPNAVDAQDVLDGAKFHLSVYAHEGKPVTDHPGVYQVNVPGVRGNGFLTLFYRIDGDMVTLEAIASYSL